MKLVRVKKTHGVVGDGPYQGRFAFQDMVLGFIPRRTWSATCPHDHATPDDALACVHDMLEETGKDGRTT